MKKFLLTIIVITGFLAVMPASAYAVDNCGGIPADCFDKAPEGNLYCTTCTIHGRDGKDYTGQACTGGNSVPKAVQRRKAAEANARASCKPKCSPASQETNSANECKAQTPDSGSNQSGQSGFEYNGINYLHR